MAPVAATASLAIADIAQLQALFGPQATVSMAAGAVSANNVNNAINTPRSAGTTFRVTVSQMPYANLIERLEQTSSRFRLRVVSASLLRGVGAEPTPAVATVSGDIIFADAR